MDIPLQQVQLLVVLLLVLLVGILTILLKLFNSEFFFFLLIFLFVLNLFTQKISATDGQPNNSVVKMKKNAKWTIYLQPKWVYDVSVTMGSQENSTYNLNLGSYIFARFFSKKIFFQ